MVAERTCTIHLCTNGVEFKVLENVCDDVPGTSRPFSQGRETYDNDRCKNWRVLGVIRHTEADLFVDVEEAKS
jgi:hypothetical protein